MIIIKFENGFHSKKKPIKRYLLLVKTYWEPKNEVILAAFLAKSNSPSKQIAKNPVFKYRSKLNRDIRTMFATKGTTGKKKMENKPIIIG